jgi:uridine kinase
MKNYTTIDEINCKYRAEQHKAAKDADDAFIRQLNAIAEEIRPKISRCPIILIAGPSGSGKTTTAEMLESIFDNTEMETHTIALDNYFRTIPKEDYVHVKSGKIDLESPERLDAELLSEHMKKLAACEPVELPVYDFTTTTRKNSGVILTRKPDEPVIFEGIHALNPDVIRIPESQRCGIYVSVQTHISSGNTVLHPKYLRLLRRMIRDRQHRGRTITQTLAMMREVERGKEQFIKPFRGNASHEIDTFFSYEPGVYRKLLLNELEEAAAYPELAPEHKDDLRLLCSVLSETEPVNTSVISENALIREFLGNA